MIEVMRDFFRIFSSRALEDEGYSVDAYYTLTGELDYLSVCSFVTLTELHHGRFKAAMTALKAFHDMPKEDQETISYLWEKLVGNRNAERTAYTRPQKDDSHAKHDKGKIRVSFFPLLLP